MTFKEWLRSNDGQSAVKYLMAFGAAAHAAESALQSSWIASKLDMTEKLIAEHPMTVRDEK